MHPELLENMHTHGKIRFIGFLPLLLGLLISSSSNCSAAVISATANQIGFRIVGPSEAAVKIGTFAFPQGASAFTEIRLRIWVDLAGIVLTPSSPQVYFRPYSSLLNVLSFSFGEPPPPYTSPFDTDLRVTNNTGIPRFSVDERQSDWVPLSDGDGTSLAALVNADPLGRVDFWLYSPTKRDVAVPSTSTTYNPITFQLTEFVHTATIELNEVVPEPASAAVYIGSFGVFFCSRRFILKRRKGNGKRND